MIGLPPTAGFLGKWFMLTGAMQTANWLRGRRHRREHGAQRRLFPADRRSAHSSASRACRWARPRVTGEAPWPIVLALTATAAGTVLLFFLPDIPSPWRRLMIGR